jgi:hypothetical protein
MPQGLEIIRGWRGLNVVGGDPVEAVMISDNVLHPQDQERAR